MLTPSNEREWAWNRRIPKPSFSVSAKYKDKLEIQKRERIVISAQEEFYPCEEDNIIENTQKMYFFYLTYTWEA